MLHERGGELRQHWDLLRRRLPSRDGTDEAANLLAAEANEHVAPLDVAPLESRDVAETLTGELLGCKLA